VTTISALGAAPSLRQRNTFNGPETPRKTTSLFPDPFNSPPPHQSGCAVVDSRRLFHPALPLPSRGLDIWGYYPQFPTEMSKLSPE